MATGVHEYTVQLEAGPVLIVGHVHGYARDPVAGADIAVFPGIGANPDNAVSTYALVSVRWPAAGDDGEAIVQYWLAPAEFDGTAETFILAKDAAAIVTEWLPHVPDAIGEAVRSVGLPHPENVPVRAASGDSEDPGSAK